MMTTAVHIRSGAASRHRRRAAPAGTSCRASLIADCGSLLIVAERLERLTADLHTGHSADDAKALVTGLQVGLAHLSEEASLLQLLAPLVREEVDESIRRATAEHAALRRLALPVIRDLDVITCGRLPAETGSFVFGCAVLAEFIRLHIDYKLETLYPLLAVSDRRPLEPDTH